MQANVGGTVQIPTKEMHGNRHLPWRCKSISIISYILRLISDSIAPPIYLRLKAPLKCDPIRPLLLYSTLASDQDLNAQLRQTTMELTCCNGYISASFFSSERIPRLYVPFSIITLLYICSTYSVL